MTAASGAEADPASQPRLRRNLAWWLVFTGGLLCAVAAFSRSGFNPTDDGLILAQAERIRSGAAPHAQIVSPRPLGSPLLHLVDLAMPTPVLLTSRVIVLVEMLLTSVLALRFLIRRPLATWRWPLVLLALAGFLLNLHSFPLMSWHTADGLLVVVASLAFVQIAFEQRRFPALAVGFLLAGYAPLIKQSFLLAPILVVAWTIYSMHEHAPGGTWSRRRILGTCSLLLVVPMAYLVWLLVTSALPIAVKQMITAESVNPIAGLMPGAMTATFVVVGGCAVAFLAVEGRRRRSGLRWDGDLASIVKAALGCVLVLAPVLVVVAGGARLAGDWGASVWWLAALSVAALSAVDGSIEAQGGALLVVGWMVSLSWGYSNPNLFAGSLLVVCLVNAGRLFPSVWITRLGVRRRVVVGATATGVVLCAALLVGAERNRETYRDVPPAQQTIELGDVAEPARGVTTGPMTGRYLRQIGSCLEDHPADHLAVVPDNAIVPLLFGKENPLPASWWDPKEIPANSIDLGSVARRLRDDGDYLVLFQTVGVATLARTVVPNSVSPSNGLYDQPGGSIHNLFRAIDGDVIICGSFVGKYLPRR